MNDVINTIARYSTYFAQFIAVLVIMVGMVRALYYYARNRITKFQHFHPVLESRLELGHTLSLGLSFLIGASILKSAISPQWDDIGKLAAIIAIRTVLNYFLAREVEALSKAISVRE